MPKLIRIILHILQLGALLAGLAYAVSYILINEGAWSGITSATLDQPYGAIIFGILAIGLSPSLWSNQREGHAAAVPHVGPPTGSYDAVPAAPPSPPVAAPHSGGSDTGSMPAAPAAPVAPTGQPNGPRPPVMAPASGQVAQPPVPPQPNAAAAPVQQPQPPGGAVPQAGTGYPTDTNPGMTQSQFAPRPGEPGGPPATDNSPPNGPGTLQNPKSPWS